MIKELSEIYYSISDFCKSVDLRPTDDCMLREVMTNWRGEQISKMRNNNPIKKGMSESGVLASKKEVVENTQSESSPKPSKKPFVERTFKPETLQKWAKLNVTPAQRTRLKGKGLNYKDDEINGMSQLDAHNILKNTRKENI